MLELPEILLTPHISGRGDSATAEQTRQLFADNLARFLARQELINTVDRDRGY